MGEKQKAPEEDDVDGGERQALQTSCKVALFLSSFPRDRLILWDGCGGGRPKCLELDDLSIQLVCDERVPLGTE